MKTRHIFLTSFLAVTGLLGLLVWLYVGWSNAARRAAPAHYRQVWQQQLRGCRTLQEVQQKVADYKPGLLQARTFPDGSWVVLVWHSIHDASSLDEEWDEAVLRDSKGHLFWTDHHFCGGEGMNAEFLAVKATSLTQFYGALAYPLHSLL